MLIVPRKRIWTQQPQGNVGIDWSNPLTKGLKVAISHRGKVSSDLVSGAKLDYGNNFAYFNPKYVGPDGVGLLHSVVPYSDGQRVYVQGWSGGAEASMLILQQRLAGPNDLAAWFCATGNTAGNSNNWIAWSDGTVQSDFGWSSQWLMSTPPSSLLEPHTVCMTVGESDQRAYFNGKLWVSNNKTGGFSAPQIINIDQDNSYKKVTWLSLWWDRKLSASEIASISANPWQIFRAPDSHIFVPTGAGAGGGDSLTASSIIAAHATVGSPLLSQQHALTASSIASAPAVVASPAITQRHALSASAVSASPAVVGSPSVTQKHVLSATAISAGPAVIGSPTLTEIVAGILSALPIVSAPAVVGTPAITQKHALSAGAISAGPAMFGTPTIAQQHALIAQGVTAGAAVVGAPVLSEGGAVIFTRAPNGGGYSRAGENYTRPPQTNTVRH